MLQNDTNFFKVKKKKLWVSVRTTDRLKETHF